MHRSLYSLLCCALALMALITITIQAAAQDRTRLDSLLGALPDTQPDSTRITIYLQIGWQYRPFSKDSGIFYSNKGIALAQKTGDNKALASLYNNRGLLYREKGDISNSITSFLRGMEYAEKTGDKKTEGNCANNIGGAFGAQGDHRKALSYFKRAMKIRQELGDSLGLASTLNNLGNVYAMEDDHKNAMLFYEEALKMKEMINDERGITSTLINIGTVYSKMQEYDKAIEYYMRSLEYSERLGEVNRIAAAHMDIGQAYRDKGEPGKAIGHLRKAIEIAEKVGATTEAMIAHHELSELYAEQKDFANAYNSHRKYVTLRDSVSSESNSQQMYELEAKYANAQKNKEIALLEKQNEIQDLDLKRKRVVIYSSIGIIMFTILLGFVIYNRYTVKKKANTLLEAQNYEINQQKMIIEEKNKDIMDSIRYAKHIQDAMLPGEDSIRPFFPDSFVMFRPRDIVSGDFYWIMPTGSRVLLAAADCTGHGVPGAFMSIVSHNVLNQAASESGRTKPAEILDSVNKLTRFSFQQNSNTSIRDGMDIALCCIDLAASELQFAGAHNPLWLVRNGITTELKGDKISIGQWDDSRQQQFTNHVMPLQKGDCIYIFSDGFADQFGGPEGKKFKYKPMQELLVRLSALPMRDAKQKLGQAFDEWKRDLEQVDDVLVIGVRV